MTATAPTTVADGQTILGIETSCDETAASVVVDGTTILSSVVSSQVDLHALQGLIQIKFPATHGGIDPGAIDHQIYAAPLRHYGLVSVSDRVCISYIQREYSVLLTSQFPQRLLSPRTQGEPGTGGCQLPRQCLTDTGRSACDEYCAA